MTARLTTGAENTPGQDDDRRYRNRLYSHVPGPVVSIWQAWC